MGKSFQVSSWPSIQKVRVNTSGLVLYPPSATLGPRLLKDYEFVWIIEGDSIAYYDDQKIDAPAGTILLPRPGMTDRYIWAPDCRTIHAFLHLDFVLPKKGWPLPRQWPLFRRMPAEDILRPLFRYALRVHRENQPLHSSLLLPCVDLMLKSFISNKLTTMREPHMEFPPPIEKAIKMIRDTVFQDHSPPLTLAQLARGAHVTPEHLCRLFRRALKLGPFECIQLARLERAAILLKRSNLTIKEISDTTGFTNPYHFSVRFRKTYGLSPRAYRKTIYQDKIPSTPISSLFLSRVSP